MPSKRGSRPDLERMVDVSKTLVLSNCTLEMTLPPLEVAAYSPPSRIRLQGSAYIEDAVIRWGNQTVRIAKLLVTELAGEMLPVYDEQSNTVRLFAVESETLPEPDSVIEGKPS